MEESMKDLSVDNALILIGILVVNFSSTILTFSVIVTVIIVTINNSTGNEFCKNSRKGLIIIASIPAIIFFLIFVHVFHVIFSIVGAVLTGATFLIIPELILRPKKKKKTPKETEITARLD